MKNTVLIVLGILVIVTSGVARADSDWLQFRGPTLQGISDSVGLPLKWSEQENVRWKTAIHGKAWSSPVIAGDQIWMTSATEDARQLFVLCVDKGSGKILQDIKLFDVPVPQFIHPFNSAASPTPLIEDGKLYVTFGAPGTACIDMKTAKTLWERRDFVCNHFRGAGASPIIFKNMLILPFDGSDFQFIVAMDKTTGKTIWRTDRSIDYQDIDPAKNAPKADGDMRKAFSTPRIATFGGQTILLSAGSKCFYCYDPETGKEIWRAENRAAHSAAATPVIGKDLIYWQTGHQKPELWAIKPGATGLIADKDIAWKMTKNVPTRGSVLLVDDVLYMTDDRGTASCVEAKTGKEVWKNRLPGSYSASPLFAEGRVYFFNEDGRATVLATGKEFKILAENKLDDGFMSTPAVSDHALYLRTKTRLYRVEEKQVASREK